MAHEVFAGLVPAAKQIQDLALSGEYTPQLFGGTTDPNLGADGVATGTWHRNGHLITFTFHFLFSGVGVDPGAGSYRISLPFPYDESFYPPVGGTSTLGTPAIGAAGIHDASTIANRQPAAVSLFEGNRALVRPIGTTIVTDSSPITWADGDILYGGGSYLADPASLP